MYKQFSKNIVQIIKNWETEEDYISRVKYVIFFVSKILYICNLEGSELLEYSQTDFMSKYVSNSSNMGIFNVYSRFNLNYKPVEEEIYRLIVDFRDILYNNEFLPANLYESLLTSKERKTLGQVYTPKYIIDNMLNEAFKLKEINKNIKILDPSCGGGYFLIEAFKKIKSKGNLIDEKYILENMIYGIDIDEFSIFMTKIGLLLQTKCKNIKFNILNIDFLIDSYDLEESFDIVIGNPPYIGHKQLDKTYRNILNEKYSEIFYDKADISYCFFKRGKEFLKEDGILLYITSRYFMEAMYADKLRAFIKHNFQIISIVDYCGIKVFKNAMVSPAVITMSNIGWNNNSFTFVKYNREEKVEKSYFKQNSLKSSGWIILNNQEEELFNRMEKISNYSINDICNIKQGIITGFDKAFVVNEETVEKYNIEKFLLKKWIKNSNIHKNYIDSPNLYLIYTNIINNERDCPNTIKYLQPYKERLMNRRECKLGLRKWYELQWGRKLEDFESPKIIFPYKSKGNNFYYDNYGYFSSADVYFLKDLSDNITFEYLQDYLNSNVFEFYFKCQAKKVGVDLFEYYPNKLNNLKIFVPDKKTQQKISYFKKINIEIFLKKVFNINEEEEHIILNKYKVLEGDDAN